jgi:hypothetical protein
MRVPGPLARVRQADQQIANRRRGRFQEHKHLSRRKTSAAAAGEAQIVDKRIFRRRSKDAFLWNLETFAGCCLRAIPDSRFDQNRVLDSTLRVFGEKDASLPEPPRPHCLSACWRWSVAVGL